MSGGREDWQRLRSFDLEREGGLHHTFMPFSSRLLNAFFALREDTIDGELRSWRGLGREVDAIIQTADTHSKTRASAFRDTLLTQMGYFLKNTTYWR